MLPLHLTNVDINDRKISARISIRGLLVLLSYMPSLYNRLQQQLHRTAVVSSPVGFLPKVPAEHVWPSCLCRGRAGNLEYTVGWTAKPGSPQCHLPTQLEYVPVSTILGTLSALEALCDYALCKSTFTLHYITKLLLHNRKLYLTYGMVLCLVTLTDLQTRRAGFSALAELLVTRAT